MKRILFLAIFLISACDSFGGGGDYPGPEISSLEGGVGLSDLYDSSYQVCEKHRGLNMLSDYEYQNSLISKRVYLDGYGKNTCSKDQMSLVYIESRLLRVEGSKEVSWSTGVAPGRRDASGALPSMVTATKIKSTVTAFRVISEALFSSAGFSNTTGYEYKNLLYVDNSGVPRNIYIGDAGSGSDVDGFANLLRPSRASSADMFLLM